MKFWPALLLVILTGGPLLAAQPPQTSAATSLEPRNVTYCELANDPAAYNRGLLRLTAFVTHGFEDFALTQPDCSIPPGRFSPWIMYGGRAESNTIYCCPGEGGVKTRSEPLEVEGFQIPLIDDDEFRNFTHLLKNEWSTVVRVTVIGRFFSGKKETSGSSTYWQGFGHLGCCSLFVIQQVEWFAPHERQDVDYTSEAGWYELGGCKAPGLHSVRYVSASDPSSATQEAIAEQREADNGARAWAFDNPERVALESIRAFDKGEVPVLRTVSQNAGRKVFRWRRGKKCIVVVVTRPYWLSFYARSNSVVWVSTDIKEAGFD